MFYIISISCLGPTPSPLHISDIIIFTSNTQDPLYKKPSKVFRCSMEIRRLFVPYSPYAIPEAHYLFLSLPTPTIIKKINDAKVTIVAPEARSA